MVSRVLLATDGLTLGEFMCASGNRLWDEVNDIGSRAHVVFPRTRVLIAQDGAHPVLATPNHVVFYKPHQRYRRGLRDTRGDRSLWLEVAGEVPAHPPAAPAAAGTYLLAVGLARYVADPEHDRLLAEETAFELLGRAVASEPPRADARRARTRADHAALAPGGRRCCGAWRSRPSAWRCWRRPRRQRATDS